MPPTRPTGGSPCSLAASDCDILGFPYAPEFPDLYASLCAAWILFSIAARARAPA